MQSSLNEHSVSSPPPAWVRIFLLALLGLAGIMALSAVVMMFGWAGGVGRMLQAGWGPLAATIMRNKIGALWHGAFMTLAAAVFLWLACFTVTRSRVIMRVARWGLILLVAADALYLSRHYVKTMSMSAMADNEVIRLLKSDMPERRVALVNQSGFYNVWLTYQFSYHHIQTLNVAQMPRMPVEYQRFLGALGPHPLRLWQLSAVGYVLAPASVWGQIQQDARMRDAFDLVYAYNVTQNNITVTVIPATPTNPGHHVVLRLKAPAPRYALIAGWKAKNDEEALRCLASNDYPLFQKVWVAPESAEGLPALTGQGMVGTIQRQSSSPRQTVLSVTTEQPAILRIADKYDPDWKVCVDGRPVPLLRVDFIFQGIYIEPGRHEVVLRYAPSTWPLWCQGIGILICLGAVWQLIVSRAKNSPRNMPLSAGSHKYGDVSKPTHLACGTPPKEGILCTVPFLGGDSGGFKTDINKPFLSVVIPTLGRPFIIRTLSSLAAASGFSKLEVLVVGKIPDDSVAEKMCALLTRYPQIRHIPVAFEVGDSSEKKNAGVREAQAEFVAFLDDDVIVAPDWLEQVMTPFSRAEVGLVSGPSLVPEDVSLSARLAGMALSSPAAGYVAHRYLRQQQEPRDAGWSQIIGCNMVYRKSVLLEIGGFNPKFWPGEEMIAAYQTAQRGHRIVFHPRACVYHYPRASVPRFIRQMFGYGATRIRLIRAGVKVEPTTLIPGLWLLSLAILLPGAFFCRWVVLLLALSIGAYVVFAVGITAVKLRTTRRIIDVLLLGYIPLMHLSYGLGEWCELLIPNSDLSEKRGRTSQETGKTGH